MIEDYNTIDAIATEEDGTICLVIMDAGLTENDEERFSYFTEKLKAYLSYLLCGGFKEDYSEKSLSDVKILVRCRLPPSEDMENIQAIANPDNHSEYVNIEYDYFPGTDPEEVEEKTTTMHASKEENNQKTKRRWQFWK